MSRNVNGLNVVVTGKIDGETRQSAEAKLREAGAHVQAAVTAGTHLLVTGAAVGATKTTAAAKVGAEIASWSEVMLGQPAAAADEGPLVRQGGKVARQIGPMLAQAHEGPLPAGGGWLFEIKWDGYRCIARCEGGTVSLQSRSGLALNFPAVVEELELLEVDCVLDGKMIMVDAEGRSSFAGLTNARGAGVVYVVFDVLEAQGTDVRGFPLEARQELLRDLLPDESSGLVRISPAFEDGEALLTHARENELEGIVAKRKGSTYQEGRRGPAWLKIKLRCQQEFVVAGWTPGKNGRVGRIGALVLAVNDEQGELILAGRCATGTDAESAELLGLLRELEAGDGYVKLTAEERKECHRDDVTWVRPKTVVQVEFQRWTDDGRLWHPSYKGRRIDKQPGDVRREPCHEARAA